MEGLKMLRRSHMTLLEVLISMFIFSIIMSVLAGLVHRTSIMTRERRGRSDQALQRRVLWDILRRDLQGMVASEEVGGEIRLLIDDTTMTFVTNSTLSEDQSDPLSEVNYFLGGNGVLYRQTDLARRFRNSPSTPDTWSFSSQEPVAVGIEGLLIHAEWIDNQTLMGNETGILPIVVTVAVTFGNHTENPEDDMKRTFAKSFFIDKGVGK